MKQNLQESGISNSESESDYSEKVPPTAVKVKKSKFKEETEEKKRDFLTVEGIEQQPDEENKSVTSRQEGLSNSKIKDINRVPYVMKNKFDTFSFSKIKNEPADSGGGGGNSTSSSKLKSTGKIKKNIFRDKKKSRAKPKSLSSGEHIEERIIVKKESQIRIKTATRKKLKQTSILNKNRGNLANSLTSHKSPADGKKSHFSKKRKKSKIGTILNQSMSSLEAGGLSNAKLRATITNLQSCTKFQSKKSTNSRAKIKNKSSSDSEKNQDKTIPDFSKMNLDLNFFDYITFYLPDSFSSSPKKRLFQNGRKLIQEKLNVKYLINMMIEFEKMKKLLFDENQNYLFEHIPPPILTDREVLGMDDADEDSKDMNNKKNLLTCNGQFWTRRSEKEKYEDFFFALQAIKNKGDEANIIDRRLIEILTNFECD